MIDIYSEDDRFLDVYQKLKITEKLSSISPAMNIWIKEATKGKNGAKIRLDAAAQMALEKAKDTLENLKAFIQYKKQRKL